MVEAAKASHDSFWEDQKATIYKYIQAYRCKWWESGLWDDRVDSNMLPIEVPEAYSFIESVMASIFTKAPSVEIQSEYMSTENQVIIRQRTNSWLKYQREAIESASRLALIAPQAFLKVHLCKSKDAFYKPKATAVEPWSVILDRSADSWDEQRFVGHIVYDTVASAKQKYPGRKWRPQEDPNFFADKDHAATIRNPELPDLFQLVQFVEFYDLINDEFIVWSQDLEGDSKILYKSKIPVRSTEDEPIVPIVPFFFSRNPQRPLEGYSALSRIYDQVTEKNIMRTYWASAVRRNSRQYLFDQSQLTEEELTQITAGIDGALIGVENLSEGGMPIAPVPNTPISFDFDRYEASINDDIQKAGLIAPFAKGVTTGVTATEIQVLQQYSTNELGKIAKERDEAIAKLAQVYYRMMADILKVESEPPVVQVDGAPQPIDISMWDKRVSFTAIEGLNSPITDAIKKQQLRELAPDLLQLGVPPQAILEELVKAYDLPESFIEEAAKANTAAEEAPSPQPPVEVPEPPVDVTALPPQLPPEFGGE